MRISRSSRDHGSGTRTSEAYEYCGYRALCQKYGVPFVDGQKEKYHAVDCAGMKLNIIINAVDRIDFLINVPVIGAIARRL